MFSTLKKIQNLLARPKILKKILKYQINQSELIFSQKKYISYLKSLKEPKIRMGAPDGDCRLNPKSEKNRRNNKSTNQNENFPKKTMLRTLKN
jgi:hypothetical protein